MKPTIKQKYKDLFITLIEEDDWAGARNLLDIIIQNAAPTNTITEAPPVVEQVAEVAPQGTDFDSERMARFQAQEEAREKRS